MTVRKLIMAAALLAATLHAPLEAAAAATHASNPVRDYLYAEYPEVASYADCIIMGESSWDAEAWNPVPWPLGTNDHAAGLGGFILSTWLTTPQGRAGQSRYDPWAAVDAVAYMIYHGRAREFGAVAVGWC